MEDKYLSITNCFTCRNLFQNGANNISETGKQVFDKFFEFFVARIIPFCSNFANLYVSIVSKKLQIVGLFWTSTFSNSNGNMKELGRKNACEKFMFLYHWNTFISVLYPDRVKIGPDQIPVVTL